MRVTQFIMFATGVLLGGGLLTGCSTAGALSAREAFFAKNPQLRSHYVEFYETSAEAMRQCVEEVYLGKMSLLAACRKNLGLEKAEGYFAEVERRINADYAGKLEFIKTIECDYDQRRDSIFYYSYQDAKGQEQGWVIVRHGKIIKKHPLATSFNGFMR